MTTPLRLLIVDDDNALRVNLVRRYRHLNMEVADFDSGEALLGRWPAGRWDVALLDLRLPGMDGIALLEKVKERQPDLEAILFTAEGSIDTAVDAMRRGAYDYVTKPVAHMPDLDIRIQKASEKVRLVRKDRQWAEHLAY
ncbi:MAG TPA: response regulator, partial [Gemmataceae bacterium]|nr:response regulator [Gemmataceae bacterium]